MNCIYHNIVRLALFACVLMLNVTNAAAQTIFREIPLAEAFAAAEKEGKLVFLDFYTDWCAPCKAMAKFEFSKPEIGEFMNSKFVCVKVNGEKGEGPALIEKYMITGYPTMIAMHTDGKEIITFHGYIDGKELVRQIDIKLDASKSLPELLKRYEEGRRDRELVKLLCEMLMKSEGIIDVVEKNNNILKAHDVAQAFFTSLPDSEKMEQDNQFVFWQHSMFPEDPAIKYLKENMETFPTDYQRGFRQLVDVTYEKNLNYYLTAKKPFVKCDFDTYRSEFAEKNLAEKIPGADVVFEFAEVYGRGDLDAYLDFCDKNMRRLSADHLHQLLLNFKFVLQGATEEQKAHAERILRHQLPMIDTQSMYYVTSIIRSIRK